MAGLQPPARSWFRLASIARMEAAEAAAASSTTRSSATPPLPRPPPIPRPQQQPNSSPPPPPPPPPQPEIKPPISTEAASPYEPQQPPTPPRVATPPESPKVIKPSFSSPPPSPTVLKQTNNNTHNPEPEPETKPPPPPLFQTSSALPEEKSITDSNGSRASKQGPPLTKEDKKLRVITMAGENTGAVMDIGSAAARRLGRKMEQEHEDSKKGGKAAAAKMKHMEAVVNSNVQGINNSIVLNSTTTQHSPGVHITFASNRKPKGSGSYEGHKAHHSDQLH